MYISEQKCLITVLEAEFESTRRFSVQAILKAQRRDGLPSEKESCRIFITCTLSFFSPSRRERIFLFTSSLPLNPGSPPTTVTPFSSFSLVGDKYSSVFPVVNLYWRTDDSTGQSYRQETTGFESVYEKARCSTVTRVRVSATALRGQS